jgi:hypothetical protein
MQRAWLEALAVDAVWYEQRAAAKLVLQDVLHRAGHACQDDRQVQDGVEELVLSQVVLGSLQCGDATAAVAAAGRKEGRRLRGCLAGCLAL